MRLAILLPAILALGFSSPPHQSKKIPKSIGINRVFLDIDHITDDKLWLRINNDSDLSIVVMNLGSPRPICPNEPEYYLERLVERRFTDEDRKAIKEGLPAAAGKTDEELAPQIAFPRLISVTEERLMNWSDAFAIDCGTLGPHQKASFDVPLRIAKSYDSIWISYDYDDGDPSSKQAPEHRLHFDLSVLKKHTSTN